jgi:hypothetical protein
MLLAAGLSACLLSGCGGGSQLVVRAPTGSVASLITPPPTSTSPATSSPAAHPAIRVLPATGLRDRQQVRVLGSGFSSGASLVVVECAAKGSATQPGDCDLTSMAPVTADGSGRVTTSLAVRVGPFGANNVRCSSKQPCLISISQASLAPGQEADAPISFSGQTG